MASESTRHNCIDVQGQQYLWLPMIIMVNRWKKLRSPSVKGFQLPVLDPLQSCLPKGLAAEEEAEEESAGIGRGRTQLLILKCEPGPTIRLRPLLPRHACFAVEKIPASWREWESELAGVQSTSQSETWWRWSQAFLALHNVYEICSPSCLDGDEPLAGLLFLQRCTKIKTKTILSSSLPFLWWKSRRRRSLFFSPFLMMVQNGKNEIRLSTGEEDSCWKRLQQRWSQNKRKPARYGATEVWSRSVPLLQRDFPPQNFRNALPQLSNNWAQRRTKELRVEFF